MKLMIVESPAKAKKIAGYLGAGWRVEACRGHVRDLPETVLGVEVSDDFRPLYQVLPGKATLVKRLLSAMQTADVVYLATDPDREGEAIAWHLLALARLPADKPVFRAVFQAITAEAVQAAVAQPRALDLALVDAQQARRILDRLVGYLVSPVASQVLHDKVSAGRVQSACLRLVVERERAIAAFVPQSHWTLHLKLGEKRTTFEAQLHSLQEAAPRFPNREALEPLLKRLSEAALWVEKAGKTIKLRAPLPPFTTSTLQQAAARAFGLSPEATMAQAQKLYEAGRITYHRTDSVAVAPEAQAAARTLIEQTYGSTYLPPRPPVYRTHNANPQEAHEAIRPTDLTQPPASLEEPAAGVYSLIWKRFIASQMAPARDQLSGGLIRAGKQLGEPYPLVFRAQGRSRLFDGFLKVYEEPEEDPGEPQQPLLDLYDGQPLQLVEVLPHEVVARPPSRYSQAALIQQLETLGIGRPSTYAGMVATLQRKGYATLQNQQLVPSWRGIAVCDFLTTHFPQVFDLAYTAHLETQLDAVAAGQQSRLDVLKTFWHDFQPQLKAAVPVPTTTTEAKPLRLRPEPLNAGVEQ